MGRKLYVGNLSYSVDSNQLSDLFGQVGSVDSANVITDRETGRSKGFGFVEMSEDSAALAVIEKFNGTDLDGRAMRISEAKPQESRSGGGSNRRGGSGGGFGSRSRY